MADDTDAGLSRLEAGQADIKGTLARLEPLLIRMMDSQSEMREEIAELKGEIRGEMRQVSARISDLNARLPVAVGVYQPPDKRTA